MVKKTFGKRVRNLFSFSKKPQQSKAIEMSSSDARSTYEEKLKVALKHVSNAAKEVVKTIQDVKNNDFRALENAFSKFNNQANITFNLAIETINSRELDTFSAVEAVLAVEIKAEVLSNLAKNIGYTPHEAIPTIEAKLDELEQTSKVKTFKEQLIADRNKTFIKKIIEERAPEQTTTEAIVDALVTRRDEVVSSRVSGKNVSEARKILHIDEKALLDSNLIGKAFREQVKRERLNPNNPEDAKRFSFLVEAKDLLMEQVNASSLDSENKSTEALRITDAEKKPELTSTSSSRASISPIRKNKLHTESKQQPSNKLIFREGALWRALQRASEICVVSEDKLTLPSSDQPQNSLIVGLGQTKNNRTSVVLNWGNHTFFRNILLDPVTSLPHEIRRTIENFYEEQSIVSRGFRLPRQGDLAFLDFLRKLSTKLNQFYPIIKKDTDALQVHPRVEELADDVENFLEQQLIVGDRETVELSSVPDLLEKEAKTNAARVLQRFFQRISQRNVTSFVVFNEALNVTKNMAGVIISDESVEQMPATTVAQSTLVVTSIFADHVFNHHLTASEQNAIPSEVKESVQKLVKGVQKIAHEQLEQNTQKVVNYNSKKAPQDTALTNKNIDIMISEEKNNALSYVIKLKGKVFQGLFVIPDVLRNPDGSLRFEQLRLAIERDAVQKSFLLIEGGDKQDKRVMTKKEVFYEFPDELSDEEKRKNREEGFKGFDNEEVEAEPEQKTDIDKETVETPLSEEQDLETVIPTSSNFSDTPLQTSERSVKITPTEEEEVIDSTVHVTQQKTREEKSAKLETPHISALDVKNLQEKLGAFKQTLDSKENVDRKFVLPVLIHYYRALGAREPASNTVREKIKETILIIEPEFKDTPVSPRSVAENTTASGVDETPMTPSQHLELLKELDVTVDRLLNAYGDQMSVPVRKGLIEIKQAAKQSITVVNKKIHQQETKDKLGAVKTNQESPSNDDDKLEDLSPDSSL